MAQSKFEYVRKFELVDTLLPNTWIVVRIDGRGFHKFSKTHDFAKPNDERALQLMNSAAERVMREFEEIVLAYGQSDEYSFIFRPSADVYDRRSSKLVSAVTSLFTSNYVYRWREHMGGEEQQPLKYAPSFDGRAVCYPSIQNMRDYLSWRQADCHINNLYNTCFWTLVLQGGLTEVEAEKRLCGTVSADKNEILFAQFQINYNNLPQLFRKGSVLYRKRVEEEITAKDGKPSVRLRWRVVCEHRDIIGDEFWRDNPHLLEA